jgi:hypothetical protein
MNLPATLALLVLGLLPAIAPAQQTIYRCGGNEYTVIPCPDGRPLDTLDSRSAAQRAEARRILEAEDKRRKDAEKERQAQEEATKPAAAPGLAAAKPVPAASAPKKATTKRQKQPELEPDRDVVAQAPATKASGTR